ncbi:MAG: methylcrotonoyl-CoA carboxylase [Gammaproteobacteria bacterium]|nr:methylcrotonoyl-CoA carboxylase [Gammaproteobacteria bacterium]
MAVLKSKIDANTKKFRENATRMFKLLSDFKEKIAISTAGGSDKAKEKHLKRGKLLARDRIAQLIDKKSTFLEFSQLAAFGIYNNEVNGAGIVTGIGKIHGQDVLIVANDATIKGGTYYPLTAKKHLRALEIAEQNHLPCAYLVDSGGAFLPKQDEVFADRDHFGRIFYMQARMSGKGIPQIAVVMGSCVAGGAYVPSMSDESVIVKNQGTIFLGGPQLVHAATGEVADVEELGGGVMHCRISGVTDHLAENDEDALRIARDIFKNINYPRYNSISRQKSVAPLYSAEDMYGIIPESPRVQYDVREIISRIVDASEFHEFKASFGQTLVCGFAHIDGYPVGILANNGVLFSESALKATHFIQLCVQRKIPLVFLQNITGFMIGKNFEQGGIAKHGAKMVTAVACANVPKYTVIIGGSFGAGNYAMCGRAYSPRQLWMWPNARISVMGGEVASSVLSSVKNEGIKARGQVWDETEKTEFEQEILQQFETQSHPYYASARIWDDGIIDPADTREVLARGLQAAANAPLDDTEFGIFRM